MYHSSPGLGDLIFAKRIWLSASMREPYYPAKVGLERRTIKFKPRQPFQLQGVKSAHPPLGKHIIMSRWQWLGWFKKLRISVKSEFCRIIHYWHALDQLKAKWPGREDSYFVA